MQRAGAQQHSTAYQNTINEIIYIQWERERDGKWERQGEVASRVATNICRTHPINSVECTILLTIPANGQRRPTTAHIKLCIAGIMNSGLRPKSEANEFIRENYGRRHLANCCLFRNWWKVSYGQMPGQARSTPTPMPGYTNESAHEWHRTEAWRVNCN